MNRAVGLGSHYNDDDHDDDDDDDNNNVHLSCAHQRL